MTVDGVAPDDEAVADFADYQYVRSPLVRSWNSADKIRTDIGGTITVTGEFFATHPRRSVQVGQTECSPVEWVSDSSLECVVAPGQGAFLGISVTVGPEGGEGAGMLYRDFSYFPDWEAVLGPWTEPSLWLSADDQDSFSLDGTAVTEWRSRLGSGDATHRFEVGLNDAPDKPLEGQSGSAIQK